MAPSHPSQASNLDDARVEELLDRFAGTRVLVVGDAFLDEYLYGEVSRVSPEAPVPVVHVQSESICLGGAGNVVRNLVALGARCEFCCAVGDDSPGDQVVTLLEAQGVDPRGVVRLTNRPTTHKTRVVARGQQVVRVDRETHALFSDEQASVLLARVAESIAGVDAVVLADYAKGLFSVGVGRSIIRAASTADLSVFVDPKQSLEPFRGAALIKPNLSEAESISGLRAAGDGGIEALGRELQKLAGGADVVLTQGERGITIFEAGGAGVRVPTLRQEVFDVQGAGDTVIATLSLARQAGASLWEATLLANVAASVVIGKTGTATADRAELRAALPAVREAAERGGAAA